MLTAGAILLKHPSFTHRMYFLLALRRQLPTNTPFFDIGVHKRTQNGTDCPHLVVRCGENHHEALTEILSDYLDGKQTTALYIGNRALASMTQEATEELFDIHQKYVDSIQRLPLFPQIVNVDRLRTETQPSGNAVNRSTRTWANSVLTNDGKSLQCDAENGGKDRKAYLLVPAQLITTVQPILHQYLASIRPSNLTYPNSVTRDRPNEIYVPTASVQRNVDFLRNMSSADVWKNAPSTIRHEKPDSTSKVSTAATGSHRDDIAKFNTSFTSDLSQMRTPIRQGHSQYQTITNQNDFPSITSQPNQTRQPDHPATRPPDDNTIATFTSTASTTLNSSYPANRFAELEAAIKDNQKDFKTSDEPTISDNGNPDSGNNDLLSRKYEATTHDAKPNEHPSNNDAIHRRSDAIYHTALEKYNERCSNGQHSHFTGQKEAKACRPTRGVHYFTNSHPSTST